MSHESITRLARAALEAHGSLDPALEELLSAEHCPAILDEVIARGWKNILDTIPDAEFDASRTDDRSETIEASAIRPRPKLKIVKGDRS